MRISPLIQQATGMKILETPTRILALALLILTFVTPAFAAPVNLYWVGATGTASTPTSGNWDVSSTEWSTTGSGTAGSIWTSSTTADAAIFGGTSSGTYAVNVPASLSAGGIVFSNSSYTLTSSVPVTISIPSGGSGAPVLPFSVATGQTATLGTNITVSISGTTTELGGGGTLIITNGASFLQPNASTLGVVSNLTVIVTTGGAFKMTTASAGGGIQVGAFAGDNAAMIVNGGTVSIANNNAMLKIGNAASATGTLTVNSGTVSQPATTTTVLAIGNASGATGTVNLNGGLIKVAQVTKANGGTATFNFNGGTLEAVNGTFASTFMTNLTAVNVLAGGAVIDNNGFNIIIPEVLATGGGTDGGLIVTNSGSGGSLALTNVNTYDGPTIVKSGAYLATTTASSGAGSYTVNDGGSLEVQVPTSGGQLLMSSLTEGTSGNLTNVFTLGANASTTTPAVAASGALTLNGTVTVNVNVTGSLTGPNTYLLLSYASKTGSGSFVAGTLPTVAGFAASLVTSSTQLKLVYTAVTASEKWAVGSGNWDTTTANWQGSSTTYTEGSIAVFDDSASGSSPITVTLTGSHTPNVITNNSTKNYIFAGSGFNLTGTPLLKNGSSTLTIDNGSANNFTAITVNGGTLQVGNGDTNGSLGSGNVADNGALVFNRTDNPTFANVISGTGGVTQNGSGLVTLSGANTYTGNTVVSAGGLTTTTASTGAGAFTVADGAMLGVQVAVSGQSLTNSSLTLGTSGNLTNLFVLGANASQTVPVIQDNGALALNGTVTVNVTGTLSSGTYTLISYASTSGSGNFVLGSVPAVATNTVALVNTGTQLQLVYTPFTSLTWDSGNTNDGSGIEAGNGTWDKNPANLVWNTGTLNVGWQDNNVPAIFGGSDGAWNINLATNVAPASITFNNSGYTFTANTPQTLSFSRAGAGTAGNIMFNTTGTNTIGTNVSMSCVATYIISGQAGTLIIANGGSVVESNSSTLNIQGGSFSQFTVSVQTGGILDSTYAGTSGTGNLQIGAMAGDNAMLSVDGGTVSLAGTNNMGIGIGTVATATGTLTINAGSVSQSPLNPVKVLTVSGASGASGTVNLNGGLLAVTSVTTGGGSSTFNFNGGTLEAVNGVFASTFMNGLSTANVLSGGAVINNNGFNITIGQTLTSGASPDGGLTSSGSGSLILTSANTYNGNTVIKVGRLALSGSGSISSSAGIVVAGGATFDVSALGSFALASSQILSNSTSTATLNGNVDASIGNVSLTYASGTPSFAVSNGALTLAGSTGITVNNTGAALTGGSYKIISKATGGSVSGTVPPSVTVSGSGLAAGATAALQITSGELYLVVSGGTPPTPTITSIAVSGTTLTITATNGADNGIYKLLGTTNLALPLSQWTPVLTNSFNGSGNLNLSTNIINPNIPDQFYILVQ